MSKFAAVCLSIILPLATLLVAPLRPARVLAASGILTVETPLHDAPMPDAAVLALLPEGSVVVIDGPPIDGYYPVTAGDLTGWMLGETLLLAKDEVAADASGNVVPEEAVQTMPADQATLDPAVGAAPDTALAGGDAAALVETTSPVSSDVSVTGPETELTAEEPPATVADAPPAGSAEAVAEPIAPAPDPAMDTTSVDAVAPALTPDAVAAATPVPMDAASEIPLVDAGVVEPVPAVDASLEAFPGAGPRGPASVTAETAILLGPGSEFGQITTAPAGSTVEQTGHLIDGYVTVQYGGITGWARLDHLGPPAPATAEGATEMSMEPVAKEQTRRKRGARAR